MSKLAVFIVLLGAVALAVADEHIRFKDCANHEISSLSFTGCTSNDHFCKVHKNQKQVFTAVFKANQDTNKVKLEMFADIGGGVRIPVPNLHTDSCDGDIKCPLVKGNTYTYHFTLTLPSVIPDVSAQVVLKLLGDHGTLACANMNGKVVEN
ncbi:Phosphatidylglycerol/phosphatidylinositol transfer protein [Tyrophagus putrescentiae]|nr:Phosphatidylglycerol/phosphatidylinositol transfer protein [Tyrophagus putrescentiae]